MLFDLRVGEHGNVVLVREGASPLVTDMPEAEPLAWAVLAGLLAELPSDRAVRAAVRGRTTGAPGILLDKFLAAYEKMTTFDAPTCPVLLDILRAWGLRVSDGPTSPLDVCCVDLAGMDPARAGAALRACAVCVNADGWLVVRGAQSEFVTECLRDDTFRAAFLDEPYGNLVSVCNRNEQELHRFGSCLAGRIEPGDNAG